MQSKSNGEAQKSWSANSNSSSGSTENPEYLRRLKVLNENIVSWIQKHVEQNPYCILTPSFKDYEKHLTDLESKHGVQQGAGKSQDKGVATLSPPPVSVPDKPPPSLFNTPVFGEALTAAVPKSHAASEKLDNKGTWILLPVRGGGG